MLPESVRGEYAVVEESSIKFMKLVNTFRIKAEGVFV